MLDCGRFGTIDRLHPMTSDETIRMTRAARSTARGSAAAPRVWQRMLSGRRLDLLDPSPLDIEIADIAHGLARVARWNGQTTGDHAFSVAEHSLLVEELFGRVALATGKEGAAATSAWRLAALLHDAPEYVIGDIISPFKAVLGDGYKAVEGRILAAVHLRFGLPAVLPAAVSAAIKRADRAAAFLEATQLAGFTLSEAQRYFGRPGKLGGERLEALFKLQPLPVAQAEARFLTRFGELWGG
jgi:5'-deoxynucleotidase YfbR-like HD superfamily hydrolase